ncbi:universal stress protein UspE [Paraglaciecola aquimarina]|uniref:Universal stress protein UspE n=1 Tax=Paraglaciecola aquimarina TaxID=1235557 RepID=A0ABU3SYK1_9ALTE|nr:universal stress protein UspE [Paraglaciecola aquimarina]MDU0355088.1 universal stress protein UspE [Paraglaciecola aquimarina]
MNYQKILAVIEPELEQQKSLSRAVDIAAITKGTVTALLTIYDFSYEMTSMLSTDERENIRNAVINERTDWLVKLVDEHYKDAAITIDVKIIWHNRPYESIIYEVIEQSYDLIVKGTQQHDTFQSVIFTPTDWHIMRKAPVPVLLVKDHDWPQNGHVLAAVNVGVDVIEHQSLNNEITRQAKYFANLLDANLHLVNSFSGTPANIVIEIPEFNPSHYDDMAKNHHQEYMREHASTHNIEEAFCHVEQGLPEDIIPKYAKQLDAELVVLGTVGRVGISAALIGNTAEHVIDKLNCDVLAIKPEGFQCPLTK